MKFMQIEPQPARGKLVESMWDDSEYLAEIKFDGIRLLSQGTDTGARFTTRRVSDVTGLYQERTDALPHLVKGHPRGCVLDMECVLPAGHPPVKGAQSKAVQSILNSSPAVALAKQKERGLLRVAVFDCLFYDGKDVRETALHARQKLARQAVKAWANKSVIFAEGTTTGKRLFYDEIVKKGGEGVILKSIWQAYGDKNGWVKVKKVATYDVVIIGFKAAKETTKKKNGDVSASRIAGKVGSVEIGQYRPYRKDEPGAGYKLEPMGFARGFGDDLMNEMTKHPKKFLGRVIEIEANDREPTGKFRHPRVTDPVNPFRDDKKAKDCIYYPEEC